MEKKEPSYTVGGNVTGTAPVENSVQVSLKIKNRASVGSYNPAPGDLSGENSEFKICRHPMFIAALLTIAKTWKQSDRQRCDVRTHTHTHNGMLAIENEKMPFAATWMDIERIILSKVSQTAKDKYPMISLICGI